MLVGREEEGERTTEALVAAVLESWPASVELVDELAEKLNEESWDDKDIKVRKLVGRGKEEVVKVFAVEEVGEGATLRREEGMKAAWREDVEITCDREVEDLTIRLVVERRDFVEEKAPAEVEALGESGQDQVAHCSTSPFSFIPFSFPFPFSFVFAPLLSSLLILATHSLSSFSSLLPAASPPSSSSRQHSTIDLFFCRVRVLEDPVDASEVQSLGIPREGEPRSFES